MQAYELLTQLLEAFREELPEADFRESWGSGAGGRLPGKPVVTGQVGRESSEGTRLDFVVYVPRSAPIQQGENLLASMGSVAETHFPALSGMTREGFEPDSSTGLLAAPCSFTFAEGGSSRAVLIGGVERAASGWKIQIDPGKSLTAIGENEPFAALGGPSYTVTVEGIDTKGLERLAGFTAELGDSVFTRCRWKSLEETGKCAVFTAYSRTEGGA